MVCRSTYFALVTRPTPKSGSSVPATGCAPEASTTHGTSTTASASSAASVPRLRTLRMSRALWSYAMPRMSAIATSS